jgi:N6-adenosine-specific RNA methylase IME4
MDEPPAEAAADLRDELVEILRQLNRAEMEETEIQGLEIAELHHMLTHGLYPQLTAPQVETAVNVLVGNGYARQLTDAEYAWDRGRVVGERYAITTEGKAYLLETLRRVNRIE